MTEPTKHVFISYVRENSAKVDELCRYLTAANIPFWTDRTKLGPGDDWKRKIRDAIRNNSLVFAACFSAESIKRETSTMNEELTIAVEEFRRRPPDTTWLIPVRFDDITVPDWDLGAGRHLSDLNYSDLFGERYHEETHKFIATVNRLLGVGAGNAGAVSVTAESTDSGKRPATFRRLTKQWVREPASQIQLDDLIRNEATRLIEHAGETLEKIDPRTTDGVAELIQAALDLAEAATALCWSIQVGANWSDEPGFEPWRTAAVRLARYAHQQSGGFTAVLALRHVPALCVTLTGAMAALGRQRWSVLKTFLVDATVNDSYQGNVALVDAENYWSPFESGGNLAQLVAAAALSKESARAVADLSKSGQVARRYTPTADWMFDLLRPVFSEQCPDDEGYAELFDRTEVVLGVLSQDLVLQKYADAQTGREWLLHSHWFGRSARRGIYRQVNLVDELRAELASQGSGWPPLQAGLFGGDPERAARALEAYGVDFTKASQQMW